MLALPIQLHMILAVMMYHVKTTPFDNDWVLQTYMDNGDLTKKQTKWWFHTLSSKKG